MTEWQPAIIVGLAIVALVLAARLLETLSKLVEIERAIQRQQAVFHAAAKEKLHLISHRLWRVEINSSAALSPEDRRKAAEQFHAEMDQVLRDAADGPA